FSAEAICLIWSWASPMGRPPRIFLRGGEMLGSCCAWAGGGLSCKLSQSRPTMKETKAWAARGGRVDVDILFGAEAGGLGSRTALTSLPIPPAASASENMVSPPPRRATRIRTAKHAQFPDDGAAPAPQTQQANQACELRRTPESPSARAPGSAHAHRACLRRCRPPPGSPDAAPPRTRR